MADVVIAVGDEEFYLWAARRQDTGHEVREFAHDVADKVVEVARTLAPKRTGRLAMEGIGARVEEETPGSIRIVAGLREHPEYGVFVHEGTGILGEHHHRVTPHTGNVLTWREGGIERFARSTAGQKPHPFVREAVVLVENTYLPARIALLGEEVSR